MDAKKVCATRIDETTEVFDKELDRSRSIVAKLSPTYDLFTKN